MKVLCCVALACSLGGCILAGCGGSEGDGAGSGSTSGGSGAVAGGDGASGAATDGSGGSGAGGDGGSDASQTDDVFGPGGAGGECGDPEVIARHTACQVATDEATCAERGGEWRAFAGDTFCSCYADDAGCPCTSASECAVGCYAEHPSGDPPLDDCAGVAAGRCVGYQVLGLWCTFENGVATAVYIDPI